MITNLRPGFIILKYFRSWASSPRPPDGALSVPTATPPVHHFYTRFLYPCNHLRRKTIYVTLFSFTKPVVNQADRLFCALAYYVVSSLNRTTVVFPQNPWPLGQRSFLTAGNLILGDHPPFYRGSLHDICFGAYRNAMRQSMVLSDDHVLDTSPFALVRNEISV